MKYYIEYRRTIKSPDYPDGRDVTFVSDLYYWSSALRAIGEIIRQGVEMGQRTVIVDIKTHPTLQSVRFCQ